MARSFYLKASRAKHPYECALCDSRIFRGQQYYRDEPHPMDRLRRGFAVRHICVTCVDGSTHLAVRTPDDRLFFEAGRTLSVPVRVEFVDATSVLLAKLREDSSLLERLGPDRFEEFVCDRFSSMGYDVTRVGATNRKDGGVDFIFHCDGSFPVLGFGQVKHRRSVGSLVGPDVVRDFRGTLASHPAQFGVIVTNTSFTADAKWVAHHQEGLVRLRDGSDLQRWIFDDFTSNERWHPVPTKIVLCPGVEVEVPIFR